MSVLDPTGYPPKVTGRGLTQSLDTLEGKTVFLVDVGWEDCDVFMREMGDWLQQHRPALRTQIVRWQDQHRPDPALCERIKAEGDAAILGVGL
jgi:hypothetical protein